MLEKAIGWCAILLLLIGIVRAVPHSADRAIAQAAPPEVITLEPEQPEPAPLVVDELPTPSTVGSKQTLEERIVVLEASVTDHKALIDSLVSTQTETTATVAKIVEAQQELQKALLGQLKQSNSEPAKPLESVKAAPQLPRKLYVYGAEWCQPCRTWKVSSDAEKIAADGCEIVPVDVDKLTPGQTKPEKIPYYELWIETNFTRHSSGPLTFEKYKRMERAILESRLKAQSSPPPLLRLYAQSEGHYSPSVEGMTIEYHLTNHHGQNIAGLTMAQMEALHQQLHGNGLQAGKSAYQRSGPPLKRLRDIAASPIDRLRY